MKLDVKYSTGEFTYNVLLFLSPWIGVGIIHVIMFFTNFVSADFRWPVTLVAFLAGSGALMAHQALVYIYIRLTKQYNSAGQWVAGGEGEADIKTPEERQDKWKGRLSVGFFIVFGLAYLFDLHEAFMTLFLGGSVSLLIIMLVIFFIKKKRNK